jgi:sirohydrochlorin ferrochelatase
LKLQSTYFLVAHGSRDPRPQVALDKLAALLCERKAGLTPASPPVVGTGTLELAPVPLREQLVQFGLRTGSLGLRRVELIPLFLLPGVHVMEDIPAEVALAQSALGSQVTVDLRHHLGYNPRLRFLLAKQMQRVAVEAWILLSHGSSRAGANEPVGELAAQLGAVPAFWSAGLGLEERVRELVAAGCRRVGIIPYFLFAGGITDAIGESVKGLRVRFPEVSFYLAEPLGATVELADLVLELVRE